MTYKSLELWQMASEVSIDIHKMALIVLTFERQEEARDAKAKHENLRENRGRYQQGYCKEDFMRFTIHALLANNETVDHLETLFGTASFENPESRIKHPESSL